MEQQESKEPLGQDNTELEKPKKPESEVFKTFARKFISAPFKSRILRKSKKDPGGFQIVEYGNTGGNLTGKVSTKLLYCDDDSYEVLKWEPFPSKRFKKTNKAYLVDVLAINASSDFPPALQAFLEHRATTLRCQDIHERVFSVTWEHMILYIELPTDTECASVMKGLSLLVDEARQRKALKPKFQLLIDQLVDGSVGEAKGITQEEEQHGEKIEGDNKK